ncbi:MAG: flagellin [Burkholderiaceae bacterium]
MAVINTNIKAIVAQDSMRQVNLKLATAMERLSTGLRINSAKDDAAGLAISERMTAQVRGFGMAIKNANDGLSMAQTADGAYGEVTSMLHRMRVLAVQAANGTMSPQDRKSLQLEIDELKEEIENVATKTHFNNIKILDGTATNVVLQVGANQGDIMNIGFDSVRTKDIGSGVRPGLTSVGGKADVFDAFNAGDLVLNGVLVSASLEADDNLSYADKQASAVAKVAAINKVTAESGVFARVNATTVQGTTMATDVGLGTFTVNGVTTATVAGSGDASTTRAAMAKAINDISDQTGVRAVDTGDDRQGVMLVADDGRNISVSMTQSSGTFTAATTGVTATATEETYVGTYSLYSVEGEPFTVSHQIGRDMTGTGLRMGTYTPNMAASVSLERSGTGTPLTAGPYRGQENGISPDETQGVGVLNGDTLIINDIVINAARTTDDTASVSTTASAKSASAIAIAAAINRKTELHGVTARAEPNVIRSEVADSFVPGGDGTVNINGIQIPVGASSRNGVIEAINAYTGQTGVMARVFGQGLELVAEDGRNITLATDGLDAENIGLAGVSIGSGTTAEDGYAFYASVKMTSDKVFTVNRGAEGEGNFERLGFREGTFGGNDTGIKVAELDVTTQDGASVAITAIDAALENVLAAQARSGAFQNRLDAALNVLSESLENISASRSRIQDADYALEATNLAKAQIVSQAATAMLAQANQSQQTVMQLLQ